MLNSIPLWFNLLLPGCIVGAKMTKMALELWRFDKHDGAVAERNLMRWGISVVLLLLAYGLPMAAAWLVGMIGGANHALKDFVFG